jgi:hypothetical protein
MWLMALKVQVFVHNCVVHSLVLGGSPQCVDNIQEAFQTLTQMIDNGTGNIVQEQMALCYNPSELFREDNFAFMTSLTVSYILRNKLYLLTLNTYWTNHTIRKILD